MNRGVRFALMRTAITGLCLSLLFACAPALRDASSGGSVSAPPSPAQLAARGYLGLALRERNEYLQAHPEDTEARLQRDEWQTQATLLEEHQMQSAQALWDGDQLGAAIAELDVGLLTLPDSNRLQRRRAYFRELLDRRLQVQRDELTLARARYVADSLRVQKQIFDLAPNESIGQRELGSLDTERRKLGQDLLGVADRALEKSATATAQTALQLALELGENERASQMLRTLRPPEPGHAMARPAHNRSNEESEQAVLEARKQRLMLHYQNAVAGKDWLSCQRDLQELMQLFPAEPLWRDWSANLQLLVNEHVQLLQQDGARRYRSGDIAGAQQVWQQALQLQPDNRELATQVDRAKRVLTNLNQLPATSKP